MSFLSRALVSDFYISYTICRFRKQMPKSSPTFCCLLYITYWKTPFKITFKNLGNFQGKYLCRSSAVVKPLRFTVILLLILKLMILRNVISDPMNLNLRFWSRRDLNRIHLNHGYKKRENDFFLWQYSYWIFIQFTVYIHYTYEDIPKLPKIKDQISI